MSVRAMKHALLSVFATLLFTAQAQALVVPISPGGGPFGLAAGNIYIGGNEFFASQAINDTYNFVVLASDLPFASETTSTVLPVTGVIRNLQVTWSGPGGVIDSLLVTNNLGSIISNGPLLIPVVLTGNYMVQVIGQVVGVGQYDLQITTTPIPPAIILFGSALAGLTILGRRRRRPTNMVAP